MSTFRKKPVEIEARQFTADADANDAADGLFVWLDAECPDYWWDDEPNQIVIPTLEGDMRASVGDWIIRGVQGEFYPCKPDIFAETYEAVDQSLDATEYTNSYTGAKIAVGDRVKYWWGNKQGTVRRVFKKHPKSVWYLTVDVLGRDGEIDVKAADCEVI